MKTLSFLRSLVLTCSCLVPLAGAGAADLPHPLLGRWALTIPGGGAGWLGVEEQGGALKSSILWGGGSVVPTQKTEADGKKLVITRESKNKIKKPDGKEETETIKETITAEAEGEVLKLSTVKAKTDGKPFDQASFTGRRIAPLPPAPDLSKIKFGDPMPLFKGPGLAGWRLINPKDDNGWSLKDGILQNRVTKEKGKHYGNLRTNAEFEDFKLTTEVRTLPNGNSGIYLRGIYEVQISESYGKPVDSHHMGALYSRITPSEAAEKPIGEWQTMEITLVQRHLTVILNGKKIINNQPITGCTGGALTSDETKPGPLYLQGDHTDVDYRNMVIRPVVGLQ